uniref:Uncharacterized protein n=1 Tax=Acrobeloides nanus TaxID=290746 RepID=A0A914C810_9BILA
MYTSCLVLFSMLYMALGSLVAEEPYLDSQESQLSSFFEKRAEEERPQRVARYDAAVRHIMLGKRAPSAERAFSMMSLGKRIPSINGERAFSMIGMGKRAPSAERAFSMMSLGKRAPSINGERAFSMIGMGKRAAPLVERDGS